MEVLGKLQFHQGIPLLWSYWYPSAYGYFDCPSQVCCLFTLWYSHWNDHIETFLSIGFLIGTFKLVVLSSLIILRTSLTYKGIVDCLIILYQCERTSLPLNLVNSFDFISYYSFVCSRTSLLLEKSNYYVWVYCIISPGQFENFSSLQTIWLVCSNLFYNTLPSIQEFL